MNVTQFISPDNARPGIRKSGLPFSERLADALRNDSLNDFHDDSPYAACIIPLLKELGWHNYARELLEALPHFSEHLDLVDLRNILVTLGYDSTPKKIQVKSIKSELYPCIFISDNNDIHVLLSREKEKINSFNADTGNYEIITPDETTGTAYVFTDTHPSHGIVTNDSGDAWFYRLLKRFKSLVFHLLAMTFLINFVALTIPLFIMVIYDKVIGAKSIETLPYIISGVATLLVADLVLRYLRAQLLGTVAGRIDYLIGTETFRQLIFLPPVFTERSTVAAQLSRLKQFDSVRDFFTGPNAAMTLEIPFAILFISVIAILAGWLAIIPVAVVFAYIIFGLFWLPHTSSKVMQSGISKTNKQRMLMQSMDGRKEIKAIGGESVWWERFRETSGDAVMASYETFIASSVLNSVSQSLMTIAGATTIGFGTLMVINGDMTIGALIATMALVWRVLTPLQGAFLSFFKFQQLNKSITQINQLMRMQVEQHSGQSSLLLSQLDGHIKVDRVSFRYGPESDPALLGVSFEAKPGEMIAICGNTGAGKSTLVKLIAGMYRPQAGSFSIDDLDIRQLNAMDLRRAISYVPQVTTMFHGTIAQNMRLNNILATDQDLHRAAEEAGVLDDILSLPEGFDTRIGDNTEDHFPPGFLRALSMARAFVNPAQIVLLDEPGASLDDESDQRLIEQLKKLKGKHTIIMVSHRPSHIRIADKAVLMEQGMVKFTGDTDTVINIMLEKIS
ncbi:MAG TPA: peptidase domain-containing ABC transporter [Gammaproteobacteria bacterium]|nr:peptidase domain-containing ABC transporter [Gammaproteobacteria bacterium]